jgi:hypothetical protein
MTQFFGFGQQQSCNVSHTHNGQVFTLSPHDLLKHSLHQLPQHHIPRPSCKAFANFLFSPPSPSNNFLRYVSPNIASFLSEFLDTRSKNTLRDLGQEHGSIGQPTVVKEQIGTEQATVVADQPSTEHPNTEQLGEELQHWQRQATPSHHPLTTYKGL